MEKVKSLFILSCGICLILTVSFSRPALSADEEDTESLGDMFQLSWTLGEGGTRMISPSGDILDSNMDALSPLQIAPIELPGEELTLEVLRDPKKAKEPLAKALYIPTDPKKRAELTAIDLEKITINQKEVLNQASAHVTTFGLKSNQNTDDFEKRRLRALEFIKTAENNREDFQVLTGATLGMVAEMNKLLSITTSRAILKAGDNLNSAYGIGEEIHE